MVNEIAKAIKCVHLPYVILVVWALYLVILNREKKKGVLILFAVLFMLAWRSVFIVSSSRYNAAFLLLIGLGLSYVFLYFKQKNRFTVAVSVCSVLLVYNLIKENTSYRNTYIEDMKESLIRITKKNRDKYVFIYKNDSQRLQSDEILNKQIIKANLDGSKETINDLCKEYDWWNRGAYIVAQEKSSSDHSPVSLKRDLIKYRTLVSFNTNKKKTRKSVVGEIVVAKPIRFLFDISNVDYVKRDDAYKNGILRAFDPDYNVWIYQFEDFLIWIIDETKARKQGLFFYHLSTNRPDLLPEKRIVHRFDNLSFHLGDKTEIEKHDNFRIYKSALPQEYPITLIHVGYKDNDTILWDQFFVP